MSTCTKLYQLKKKYIFKNFSIGTTWKSENGKGIIILPDNTYEIKKNLNLIYTIKTMIENENCILGTMKLEYKFDFEEEYIEDYGTYHIDKINNKIYLYEFPHLSDSKQLENLKNTNEFKNIENLMTHKLYEQSNITIDENGNLHQSYCAFYNKIMFSNFHVLMRQIN